jgi:phosphatidylinositol 4-phosphatase
VLGRSSYPTRSLLEIKIDPGKTMICNQRIEIHPEEILAKRKQDTLVIPKCRGEKRVLVFDAVGIYGVININGDAFVIFVVGAEERGKMYGHSVYEIAGVEIVKVRDVSGRSHSKRISGLKSFFSLSGIYFSTFPLHQTISMKKSEDVDFLFNHLPLARLGRHVTKDAEPFSLKCIQGYFGAESVYPLELRLISRRSWRRTGARFFSRGSNAQGYVSNFVETEQVVYHGDMAIGYLQIRGSIPLLWTHILSREYNPPIVIGEMEVLQKADQLLEKKYKEVMYLNLIRSYGYEKALFESYERELVKNNIKHINFDFFKAGVIEGGSAVDELIAAVDETLENFGYFTRDGFQSGVIRTNCLDCLDRTNASQYVIGSVVINKQLAHFDPVDKSAVYGKLRMLWHSNGNSLSMQYSGTHAIKGGYVKDGRHTLSEKLIDLCRSTKRYLVNRLCHGQLQMIYDILTTEPERGHTTVVRGGVEVIGRMGFFLLLMTWVYTWLYTNSFTLRMLMSNTLTALVTFAFTLFIFLEFFIETPGH